MDGMEDPGLVDRWRARQEQLAEQLERYGATGCERQVEWVVGLVEWVDLAGETVTSADMRALCSYAIQEETLMMAWANQGLEEGAVIDPLPDVPEYIEECSEAEAWLWAMRLAEESGAEYLYRVATPEYLVFLALWNLRSHSEGVPIVPGSAHAFVLDLLENLVADLPRQARQPGPLSRLFINQGESLRQNARYLCENGADLELLNETSHTLIETGNSFGQRRFALLPPAPLSEKMTSDILKKLNALQRSWRRSAQRAGGDQSASSL